MNREIFWNKYFLNVQRLYLIKIRVSHNNTVSVYGNYVSDATYFF